MVSNRATYPHLFSLPELDKTPASTAVVTFNKKNRSPHNLL